MLGAFLEQVTLARGLAALSLEELALIARRVGLADSMASKARFLAELPGRLADDTTVRKLIRELNASAARAFFVSAAAETFLPLTGAHILFRWGATTAPRALTTRGLLLPDTATALYRTPREILPFAAEEFRRRSDGAAITPPPITASLEPGSALRDVVTVWCYVLKNPVPLTQAGAIPRRTLTRLATLWEVNEDEEPLSSVLRAFNISRVEYLMNYADRRGAFSKRENIAYAADWPADGFDRWEEHFPGQLVGDALTSDATASALLATYVLAAADEGQWFDFKAVVNVLRELGAETDAGAATRGLFALFITGYAAAGITAGGNLAVARARPLVPLRAPEGVAPTFWVGANFEVKAPYDIPVTLRLKLEAFADQVAGGKFLSFQITKASFYRALDAGITAEEVIAFLSQYATGTLPQNVVFSLNDWAGQYGRLEFFDRLLLLAPDEAACAEVANLPSVAPYVRRRLEVHGLEISPADYEIVRDALLAAGFLPRSLKRTTEMSVSPRRLFAEAGSPNTDVNDSSHPASEDLTAAVLDFAISHGRAVRLWLEGETEPVVVTPRRIFTIRGEKRLTAEGNEGRLYVPLRTVAQVKLA